MKKFLQLAGIAMLATVMGGCPQRAPDNRNVIVRVENNTNFDVDPGIQFGRSTSSLSNLDTDVLTPGEFAEFEISCTDAQRLTATEPTQLGDTADFVLDSLPFFRQGSDFACEEEVVFEFVGDEDDFDVIVTANGDALN